MAFESIGVDDGDVRYAGMLRFALSGQGYARNARRNGDER